MDAHTCLGEPRLLISHEALRHNAGVLRAAVGDSVRICAILKADAYGHGAAAVARTLARGRLADALAVANLDEASALPEVGLPVIVFRPVENVYVGRQRNQLEEAIERGWTLTICSAAAAGDVARLALARGKRATVQVKIDTGMSRSGVDDIEAKEVIEAVSQQPSLRLGGLCTHFACADELDDVATAEQFRRFCEVTDGWVDANRTGRRPIRHAANTAGMLLHPDMHLDMVRPGLGLYGIDPMGPATGRQLKPVMKWVAPLLMVRTVRKGTSVGYGLTWTAPRDTRLGLVPVGYADGYMRSYSNRAKVIVNGVAAAVVGRVSMDLITVELGSVPSAQQGDEVTLLKDDPASPASAYALAELGGTIPYEIFCRIGSRVHRVAVDEVAAEAPERAVG
ncbi:MAG: alanine racemase [Phycisphaerales bacterium]|nr:alanine racemase [Phycisphaerales bacterium]